MAFLIRIVYVLIAGFAAYLILAALYIGFSQIIIWTIDTFGWNNARLVVWLRSKKRKKKSKKKVDR